MSFPVLREMRATDMVRLTRYMVPQFAGFVAVKDGKDIGAAAIVWGDKGRPFLCLEIMTPDLQSHVFFMHRLALDLIKAITKVLPDLYAIEDRNSPSAPRWLARLGFKPTDETLNGEKVLRWHQS